MASDERWHALGGAVDWRRAERAERAQAVATPLALGVVVALVTMHGAMRAVLALQHTPDAPIALTADGVRQAMRSPHVLEQALRLSHMLETSRALDARRRDELVAARALIRLMLEHAEHVGTAWLDDDAPEHVRAAADAVAEDAARVPRTMRTLGPLLGG